MKDWTVTVEWTASEPVTIEQIEELADTLAGMGGVVSGGPGFQNVGAIMTVTGTLPDAAVSHGIISCLGAIPGEVVSAEAMTTEEHDRRLGAEGPI